MEYIKCKSCQKILASFDTNSITNNLHIQCRSCKAYNVITDNKVQKFYIKIGKKLVKDNEQEKD